MSDINEELTTEHDIYISIGLKHPMKPIECRDLIDSLLVENFTLDSWGTHTKDEWIDVVNECQEKVNSLITTIESQNAEIEKLREIQRALVLTPMQKMSRSMELMDREPIAPGDYRYYETPREEQKNCTHNSVIIGGDLDQCTLCVSQQAITELAVKGLKNIVASGNECTKRDLKIHAQLTLSEIERLQNE